MKLNSKNIFKLFLGAGLCLSMASCESYLDKEADTDVSETEAFKNFTNFQGFVENIYGLVPDKFACNWSPSWNWGDDEVFNVNGAGNDRMTTYIDNGNFRKWFQSNLCWLQRSYVENDVMKSNGLWNNMWKAIRIANLGLENIEKIESGEILYSGTEEELQFLKGQMLFFRAWWHFEMACYVGGLPYIDRALGPTEKMDEARLSYTETLAKCAADFKAAADLLPYDWDLTATGRNTRNNNELRINKAMALGYAGKALLFQASPFAKQGATVSGNTYDYDKEVATEAAKVLGQLLSDVEAGQTIYQLASFKNTNIYDHKNGDKLMEYSSIFYTLSNTPMPGAHESMFRNLCNSGDANYTNWQHAHVWGPKFGGLVTGDNLIHQATSNYVHYAYGMANGLPLDDPNSGFDPTQPWKNRDPRFYHDIVFDGFKFVNGNIGEDNKSWRPYQYCLLSNDPSTETNFTQRDNVNGARTGYYIQKLIPHTCNQIDDTYKYLGIFGNIPYLRLADIYLMYAEAVSAATDNPRQALGGCPLTALDAVNKIRERCGAGPIGGDIESGHTNALYLNDNNKFMDEVRRERAAELAFEGYRYLDLQRWLLLTGSVQIGSRTIDFTRKYALDIKRVGTVDYSAKDYDPADIKYSGYNAFGTQLVKRNFTAQHYLFPLPTNQTYFSDKFQQNPGW